MGAGRPVLYYDTPENREVAGDAGERFRFDGDRALEIVLSRVLENDDLLVEMGLRSRRRVDESYLWSHVADAYEGVLEGLC